MLLMIIISNNCMGGFIYRDILKTQYCSPFIWTALSHDDFFDLCRDYDKINFLNIQDTIDDTETTYHNNRNALLIDDRFLLKFHHVWEDASYEKPTVIEKWGAGMNVMYKDPKTFIKEKYLARVTRMKNCNKKLFVFYDVGHPCHRVEELYEICETQKCFAIILTSEDVKIKSGRVLVLKTDNAWATAADGWHKYILNQYSDVISHFIENLTF